MRYQYTQQEKENVVTNFMKNDKVTKVPAKKKEIHIISGIHHQIRTRKDIFRERN